MGVMSQPTDAVITERDTAKGDVTVVEMTRRQETVARRAAESKATVPDLTLGVEADVEAVAAQAAGGAFGLTDALVKAAAMALREVPDANSAFRDHRFERYSRINVGVAVFAGDGVLVPTIFDADRKPLEQIAQERRTLAAKVAEGSIAAPELANGTFTLYDLAELGVRRGASIVNAPQAATLTAGAPEARAVVRDGAVVPRTVVDLTLSCDHRILYGAPAGRLLTRIGELLADPAALA
jgi:pyruvate dehydrogenase E2 component (dihydrolipoamide acetyltransferase)